MAKYLYRTCPKCKDYMGVVVPEPAEPVSEVPIDARCCWGVSLGMNVRGELMAEEILG